MKSFLLKKETKQAVVENKSSISSQWDIGYEDGKQMALSLGRPVRTEDFPKKFQHRGDAWSRGYAEGVIAHGIYIKK
jgi:hypothetical protein